MRSGPIAAVVGLAVVLAAAPEEAFGKKCKGNEFKRAACRLKKGADKAVGDVDKASKRLGPLGEVAGAVVKVQLKTVREAGRATEKAVTTVEKAGKDTAEELKRAERNAAEAVRAIGHFVENQVESAKDTLSDAEKRFRQGKFADAFWHLATDQYRHAEENAYKAAAESSLIRTVGSVAASTYGGPQGAAAYAAWFTYKQTNDLKLAVKVGLITGASNAGFKTASKMPTDELLKKTVVTAAIGGAAVAASGGDDRQVLDGFLRSGAMVLIQDGYSRVTGGSLDKDARVSNGVPYCMQALPNTAECAPPPSSYVRNADGSLAKGPDGKPIIDVKKIDHTRQVTGLATDGKPAKGMLASIRNEAASDRGIAMRTLSMSVPGLNAGALFHDQWVMATGMSAAQNFATLGPAIVLIYNGTAAPVNEQIRQAATAGRAAAGQGTGVRAAEPASAPSSSARRGQDQEQVEENEPTRPVESFVCRRGSAVHVISTQLPTEMPDLACGVVYERDGQVTLPWYAQYESGYCIQKAREFVKQHEAWGFECLGRSDAVRSQAIALTK